MRRFALCFVAVVLSGCATYYRFPTESRGPAELRITGTVAEFCGSIGGCQYRVVVEGPTRTDTFDLVDTAESGHDLAVPEPITLTPGTYTVTYRTLLLSDDVKNGVVAVGATGPTCAFGFVDTGIGQDVRTHAVFRRDDCDVELETPRRL